MVGAMISGHASVEQEEQAIPVPSLEVSLELREGLVNVRLVAPHQRRVQSRTVMSSWIYCLASRSFCLELQYL
jgi:hypothetical protein